MKRLRSFMIVTIFSLMLSHTVSAQTDSTLTPATEDTKSQLDMYQAIKRNINLFGSVYREINMKYVDQINPEEFIKSGITGMLGSLDPYTEYFEQEETDDLQIMTQGKYGGIGIQIGLRGSDRALTIISPIDGTPGARLGLKAGDRIVEIDGESTDGFTTSDAAKRMRGDVGSSVKIKIERYGVSAPIEYTVVREEIKVHDVSFSGFVAPGIGMVRLARFSRSAGDDIRSSIEDLKKTGLRGMILDLRGNPGGLLPEAINLAENFVAHGETIVSTKGRVPTSIREYKSDGEPVIGSDIPLVVLVNEGSASASEIVAGAIQDLDRGVIVGKTSFGKGLVQSVVDFRDGTALKITTAKYYTPSGRLIQKADYFNENKSIIHNGAGDTENEFKYYTRNGRQVNSHGGIEPDFTVEMPEVGYAVIELWRAGAFFDFAGKYLGEHPEVKSYEITDVVYQEFLAYLQSINFTFETETERKLKDIRQEAETFKYGDEFLSKLTSLEEAARSTREHMLEAEKDEIGLRLRAEFASVLGGNNSRVLATVDSDPQIQKAIQILNESDLYSATLVEKGDGDPVTTPIAPEKR